MKIRNFLTVVIMLSFLVHQCFAYVLDDEGGGGGGHPNSCGIVTPTLIRCLDVYGEPWETSCTSTPCAGNTCLLPWESVPALGNYNLRRPLVRAGDGQEPEDELFWSHHKCYTSTFCDGCLFDPNWGISFCQKDLVTPGFDWNLWWPLALGPCP